MPSALNLYNLGCPAYDLNEKSKTFKLLESKSYRSGVNRRMDRRILKIFLHHILDSKRDFNGFPDPVIAADCGFIDFLGPDFGLCV